MSNPDEKAFESLIAGWLLDYGGYDAVKVGLAAGQHDFDPASGIDTG